MLTVAAHPEIKIIGVKIQCIKHRKLKKALKNLILKFAFTKNNLCEYIIFFKLFISFATVLHLKKIIY